jgi:hypothetical protein
MLLKQLKQLKQLTVVMVKKINFSYMALLYEHVLECDFLLLHSLHLYLETNWTEEVVG